MGADLEAAVEGLEVGAAVEGLEVDVAVADCRQALQLINSRILSGQHAMQQLKHLRRLQAPGNIGQTADADGSQYSLAQQSAPGGRWAWRRWRAWRWVRWWRTAGRRFST